TSQKLHKITPTSFAPSPIAKVMLFNFSRTSRTTSACNVNQFHSSPYLLQRRHPATNHSFAFHGKIEQPFLDVVLQSKIESSTVYDQCKSLISPLTENASNCTSLVSTMCLYSFSKWTILSSVVSIVSSFTTRTSISGTSNWQE